MEVKYKGEIFTKILARNQKNAGTISSLASGQIAKLISDNARRSADYIYVHKTLLAAGSPMLKQLLQEDDSVCPRIIIPDFEISIVEKFSRLLYHGCTKVDEAEIETIRQLAQLLGFPTPTLAKKATEDIAEASTILHYSRAKKMITGSTSKDDHPQQCPLSINAVSTPISLNTPQSPAQSSESGSDTNQTKPAKRRRRRKQLGKLPPEVHTSSDDDRDSDFVPSPIKKKVDRGRKIITSSATSTEGSPNVTPNPYWSKTSRMFRGSQNGGDLNPATDYWNQFIKCYFCSSSFSNEPSLLRHLTTKPCGAHLSGHLQLDTKFCNFCNKIADSLTCWGYLKHLDTCYRKSLEEIRKLRGRSENGSSDETIPNRNFKGSVLGKPRYTSKEIPSVNSRENVSSESDSDISIDIQPIAFKPLYIHSSAVLSVQKFRAIKKQYEVLTDIRRKRQLALNAQFSMSPIFTTNEGQTQASSKTPLIPNNIRMVKKIEMKETEIDNIDGNMAELFTESDDDFVLPTISNVFSLSMSNADSDSHANNAHEPEASKNEESQGETSTAVTAPCIDEGRKMLETEGVGKHIEPFATKSYENACKTLSQQSIVLNPTISPPFEIISSDSEIEIVSEVTSMQKLQNVQKQTSYAKKRRKSSSSHSQQSTWNSLLLEAVKRICSRNERPDVGSIHKTLRMLSLSENENYPIYPVFKRPSPFTKQIKLIQKHLDKAVKRKLLTELLKNGEKYYLPSGPHHAKFHDSSREEAKVDQQNQPNHAAIAMPEPDLVEPRKSNQNQNLNPGVGPIQQMAKGPPPGQTPNPHVAHDCTCVVADTNEIEALPIQSSTDAIRSLESGRGYAGTIVGARVERMQFAETVVNTLTIVHSGTSSGSSSTSGYRCPNPNWHGLSGSPQF